MLLLAQGLVHRLSRLNTLIVTESAMAHSFRVEPGTDYVKLPSVVKVADEEYASRTIDEPFENVRRIRRELIRTTALTYRPDIVFIDNVPLAMKGEALAALQKIRDHNPDCRIVLNLRDVIDAPERIVPLRRKLGVFEALDKYYDEICVYGHRQVFDVAEEYCFPDPVRATTCYCATCHARSIGRRVRWRFTEGLRPPADVYAKVYRDDRGQKPSKLCDKSGIDSPLWLRPRRQPTDEKAASRTSGRGRYCSCTTAQLGNHPLRRVTNPKTLSG